MSDDVNQKMVEIAEIIAKDISIIKDQADEMLEKVRDTFEG